MNAVVIIDDRHSACAIRPPHRPRRIRWLLSGDCTESAAALAKSHQGPLMAGCRSTSCQRRWPVPLRGCRPNEKLDSALRAAAFLTISVRGESPHPKLRKGGSGSECEFPEAPESGRSLALVLAIHSMGMHYLTET